MFNKKIQICKNKCRYFKIPTLKNSKHSRNVKMTYIEKSHSLFRQVLAVKIAGLPKVTY